MIIVIEVVEGEARRRVDLNREVGTAGKGTLLT